MGLKNVFKKAADIAFKVAENVKVNAIFTSITDNGFEDPVIAQVTVEAIRMEFVADDYRALSFRELIQPYDLKLLIKCDDLSNIDSNDKLTIDGIEYSIIGCEKDAADAVWTIGIR